MGRHAAQCSLLVATLCDLFLEYSSKRHTQSSYDHYLHFLQDFCKKNGKLPVNEIKPFHVTRWLDSHGSWKGARRSAVISLKRAFSWGEQEGLIPANPIRHIKKPPVGRRTRVITADEKKQILAAIPDVRFRNFVVALQESGCRPSEVANVTAEQCDLTLGVWVLTQHKTAKKTGKPRIVYLTPTLLALTQELVKKFPTGQLFPNLRGRRFTINAIRCRFRRLREKLPNLKNVVAYTYRHTFATDALIRGVGMAVSELIPLLAVSENAAILELRAHLAFDNTRGATEREFFQSFLPDERGLPLISIRAKPEVTVALLERLFNANPRDRILRACAQYHQALMYWAAINL